MVAVLWRQGFYGATVQLEKLWHQMQTQHSFSLFCAYPKSGFTQSSNLSIFNIIQLHNKVIEGKLRPATQVYERISAPKD
jgi:hypothetical protein